MLAEKFEIIPVENSPFIILNEKFHQCKVLIVEGGDDLKTICGLCQREVKQKPFIGLQFTYTTKEFQPVCVACAISLKAVSLVNPVQVSQKENKGDSEKTMANLDFGKKGRAATAPAPTAPAAAPAGGMFKKPAAAAPAPPAAPAATNGGGGMFKKPAPPAAAPSAPAADPVAFRKKVENAAAAGPAPGAGLTAAQLDAALAPIHESLKNIFMYVQGNQKHIIALAAAVAAATGGEAPAAEGTGEAKKRGRPAGSANKAAAAPAAGEKPSAEDFCRGLVNAGGQDVWSLCEALVTNDYVDAPAEADQEEWIQSMAAHFQSAEIGLVVDENGGLTLAAA